MEDSIETQIQRLMESTEDSEGRDRYEAYLEGVSVGIEMSKSGLEDMTEEEFFDRLHGNYISRTEDDDER